MNLVPKLAPDWQRTSSMSITMSKGMRVVQGPIGGAGITAIDEPNRDAELSDDDGSAKTMNPLAG